MSLQEGHEARRERGNALAAQERLDLGIAADDWRSQWPER